MFGQIGLKTNYSERINDIADNSTIVFIHNVYIVYFTKQRIN